MRKFLLFFFSFSLFADLTLDEKIGQLFMAPACPMRGEDHWQDWVVLLNNYHIGNAIVYQSDIASQIQFLDRLQARSKLPLLISADAEWGLGMRMKGMISCPRNMTLGAMENVELIYEMGKEIGRQARSVGVHMNLAPVADVNNNPKNPIIHTRSFGDDPSRVAECVSAYSRGMQEAGLLTCGKHFPGHGDTTVDSHKDLPVLEHSRERLEAIEFVPFKRLIQNGVDALMTAHLYVPCLDPIYPTTLSEAVFQKLLREEMGFQGLIVSDALNMKALADRYSVEEVAVRARKAGCDLLLYGDHKNPNIDDIMRVQIPRAFRALKEAYLTGELDLEKLDETVARIMAAKEKVCRAIYLKKRLFQEAVTQIGEIQLVGNRGYLSIGKGEFDATLTARSFDSFDQVIISVYQLIPESYALIEALADKAIVCWYVSPYGLQNIPSCKNVLIGYQSEAEEAVLDVLYGRKQAKGHLPVKL
jgi:beta-glucosidase-like glycosyl hydrolase